MKVLFLLATIFVLFQVYAAHEHDHWAYPKYDFNYGVADHHTDDHKSQHEHRDGGLTKGDYERHQKGVYHAFHYVVDSHHH